MGQEIRGPQRTGDSLADVVEMILDKGLVIDIMARVLVVGIELIRIEARIIVASVDTYLRLAEAAMRLEQKAGKPMIGPLAFVEKGQSLADFVGDTVGAVTDSSAEHKAGGAIRGAKKALKGDDD